MNTRTVVVAEDDFEMRRLITSALQERHYQTLEAADGTTLLELLSAVRDCQQLPALIVSDIRMPGTHGLSVLQTVRSWGWRVPFVIITSFGSEETLGDAIGLGATAVLCKPFTLEDLCIAVRYLVR